MDCIDLFKKPPLPCRPTPATWSWTLPAARTTATKNCRTSSVSSIWPAWT